MKLSIRSGLWWMPAKRWNQEHTFTNGLPLTASWQVTSAQSLLKNKLQEIRSCWRRTSSQRLFWRGILSICPTSLIQSIAPEVPKKLNFWLQRTSYTLPRRIHLLSLLCSSTKTSSKRKVPWRNAGNVQSRSSTTMTSAILNDKTKAGLLLFTTPLYSLRIPLYRAYWTP